MWEKIQIFSCVMRRNLKNNLHENKYINIYIGLRCSQRIIKSNPQLCISFMGFMKFESGSITWYIHYLTIICPLNVRFEWDLNEHFSIPQRTWARLLTFLLLATHVCQSLEISPSVPIDVQSKNPCKENHADLQLHISLISIKEIVSVNSF